jgi:hypothetical protein
MQKLLSYSLINYTIKIYQYLFTTLNYIINHWYNSYYYINYLLIYHTMNIELIKCKIYDFFKTFFS